MSFIKSRFISLALKQCYYFFIIFNEHSKLNSKVIQLPGFTLLFLLSLHMRKAKGSFPLRIISMFTVVFICENVGINIFNEIFYFLNTYYKINIKFVTLETEVERTRSANFSSCSQTFSLISRQRLPNFHGIVSSSLLLGLECDIKLVTKANLRPIIFCFYIFFKGV